MLNGLVHSDINHQCFLEVDSNICSWLLGCFFKELDFWFSKGMTNVFTFLLLQVIYTRQCKTKRIEEGKKKDADKAALSRAETWFY